MHLRKKVKNGGRTQVLILMKQICKLQESIYKNLSLFMTGFINKICIGFLENTGLILKNEKIDKIHHAGQNDA